MTDQTTTNPLEMSDEDFLKLNDHESLASGTVTNTETDTTATGTETQASDTGTGSGQVAETATETNTEINTETETQTGAEENTENKAAETTTTEAVPADTKSSGTEQTQTEVQTEKKPDETQNTQVETVDYESLYKEIMKPFKANGRTIELKDPSEAIRLMQMGSNYTRRMQDLSEAKKIAMTLESNGITPDKLSFLIDLDKKNPEAIKKLLKDSGIDPMDIDTSVEPTYVPGNHQVSNEAVQFNTVLEDVASTPEGKDTLAAINTTWDDTSKDALWNNPEIMRVMHEQRTSGVYDVIKAEVDRRITLGAIPTSIPFLQAYKTVGDEMVAQVAGSNPQGGQSGNGTGSAPTNGGQVVATRAAAPKPAVVNDERASAASSTRAAPSSAGMAINPLAMSDEDFLKHMNGKV